ncbi:hypothetical protein O5274_26860, partial [Escherichia coli]|nr:hypothetical protein [Escherichia coli]
PISSPGYRTGGAAGGALIRSATSWSNIRKPVSTGSVRVRCWCCEVVAEGPLEAIMAVPESLTGQSFR